MAGSADWGFLDDFYLTKQLATDSLQERVQRLHAQLQSMEEEYMTLLRQCSAVNADLDKIEEKAAFVMQEAEAVERMFEPPPFVAPEDTSSQAWQTTKAVLDVADYSLMGVWATAGLASYAMNRPFKAAQKTLGAKSPMVKAMQGSPKFARAKMLAKLSSKAGAAGLVIMGTMWLLSLKDADKLNAALKDNAEKIKKQIAELEEDMQALRGELSARRAELGEVLGEADVNSIGAYVMHLGKVLTELAEASANTGVARRMLIDGLPVALVMRVSGLADAQITALKSRIDVERALLDGGTPDAIAADKDRPLAQVVSIGVMQRVRGALVRGTDMETLIAETNLTGSLLDSENRRVLEDLRPHWKALSTGADLAEAAQMMLVPSEDLTRLSEELQAKAALITESPVPFGTPDEHAQWSAQIAAARAKTGAPSLLDPESTEFLLFALNHRLPLTPLSLEEATA